MTRTGAEGEVPVILHKQPKNEDASLASARSHKKTVYLLAFAALTLRVKPNRSKEEGKELSEPLTA
jgi:hypothetical protein